MKKNNKNNNDEVFLIPLNKNLYNEFSLDELEQRMETDPIVVMNDLMGKPDEASPACFIEFCDKTVDVCIERS